MGKSGDFLESAQEIVKSIKRIFPRKFEERKEKKMQTLGIAAFIIIVVIIGYYVYNVIKAEKKDLP